jgi:hypothetical protein
MLHEIKQATGEIQKSEKHPVVFQAREKGETYGFQEGKKTGTFRHINQPK